MGQIVAAQIGNRHLAEDVVQHRGRHLDGVVALDQARGLEPGEGEGLDIFVQRYAILQADRDCDGEVVHQRAEGRAFLVHVDEDFADRTVLVLAGAQIDLVPADRRLLSIALAAARQAPAVGAPFDNALDDALGHHGRRGGRRFGNPFGHLGGFQIVLRQQAGGKRLAELRSVAVERIGLDTEAPGQHVGVLAGLDRRVVRHVYGLGDCARDEGLGRRHDLDMAFHRKAALAGAAAGIGAVEDRQMLVLEMRGAFQRHRTAAVVVGRVDFASAEAQRFQHVETDIVQLCVGETEDIAAEFLAQGPFVEGEADIEGVGQ